LLGLVPEGVSSAELDSGFLDHGVIIWQYKEEKEMTNIQIVLLTVGVGVIMFGLIIPFSIRVSGKRTDGFIKAAPEMGLEYIEMLDLDNSTGS